MRRLFGTMLAGAAVMAAGALVAAAPKPVAGRAAAAPVPRPGTRPNIVVILVDDLGWPDVSSYGRREVLTPNIDRIAKSGVAFSSGYVAASVCAVSRAGLLTGPLRDRFGFTGHMDFYDPAELVQVLTRSAELLGVTLRSDGAAEIAGRSRGTPRIANRLLRRVRDYAEVRGDGTVTLAVARAALAVYDVD